MEKRKSKRIFSSAEKVKMVQKILRDGLDYRKMKDEDGEPIHYGTIQNWIRKYKTGEFGARYMNDADQASPSKSHQETKAPRLAPPGMEGFKIPGSSGSASGEDITDLWKYIFMLWKYIFELQTENDALNAQVKSPTKQDRRKASLISQLAKHGG